MNPSAFILCGLILWLMWISYMLRLIIVFFFPLKRKKKRKTKKELWVDGYGKMFEVETRGIDLIKREQLT